ncbi:unnamed protein product [Cuscuta campestris]|uniref:Reverse transcriptase Ty1/copia-type domain-containing protein n=1 Tax=Cuscuta campestris TaxID=132261 RepID=A0A484NLY7_9ASTE|nr:unnamed protein product [Cuscuta campestris]
MLTGTVIHRSNIAGPLYPMSQTATPAQAQQLKGEFAMTDMGDLNFFLGINVQRTAGGLFLHQTQFAHEILERADMLHCKPISTPVDTKAKLSATSGTPLPDPTIYRSIVGALQYLTFTRPDLTYAVQQLCLHLHAPRSSHLTAMKRGSRLSYFPNSDTVSVFDRHQSRSWAHVKYNNTERTMEGRLT